MDKGCTNKRGLNGKVNELVTRVSTRTSYWLLVRDGRNGCTAMEVLGNRLPDGRRELLIFSFEEEAEMFLCLRGSEDGWRVRHSSAGELLWMLGTVLRDTGCVMLDPIPESPCLDSSGLLSIGREEFVRRLKGAYETPNQALQNTSARTGTFHIGTFGERWLIQRSR